MKKQIEERSYRVRHDIDNLYNKESRERAKEVINLLVPKTPNVSLKRFGNENDGGYVLADDIASTDFLFSFGVAENILFEDHMSRIVDGIDMYDYSVSGPPYQILNSRFYKEKIGKAADEGFANIKKCFYRSGEKKDYILKIDIEGSEWNFFNHTDIQDLLSFRQIIVEFHWIDKILDNEHYKIIKNVLSKINLTHQSVNVHGNNYGDIVQFVDLHIPEVLEVTFLRKNSYTFSSYNEKEHNKINAPCDPNAIDIDFVYREEI
jgi:hypothetical protein